MAESVAYGKTEEGLHIRGGARDAEVASGVELDVVRQRISESEVELADPWRARLGTDHGVEFDVASKAGGQPLG